MLLRRQRFIAARRPARLQFRIPKSTTFFVNQSGLFVLFLFQVLPLLDDCEKDDETKKNSRTERPFRVC